MSQETAIIPAGMWKIDPVHSDLSFEVVDTTDILGIIRGRFRDFDGTLEQKDGSVGATGVIQVASVDTGERERDDHLRSTDYFDADSYPEMRFESDAIEALEDGRFRARGTLTIKDEARAVSLEGSVLGGGVTAKGDERVVLKAAGQLDWGEVAVRLSLNVSAKKVQSR